MSHDNVSESCKFCGGKGIIGLMDDFGMTQIRICPVCNGTGVQHAKNETCTDGSRGD